jgi:putative phosphoribosyl transferase
MRFRDRSDAGRRLATRLADLPSSDLVVLALPRGGVPVAFEVASALGVLLDVIIVRKLGVALQPELAMGAIGEDGVRVVNDEVIRNIESSASDLAAVEAREREELDRRVRRYRHGRERLSLIGRTGLIVDDGIATGSTARAACAVARAYGAARVIVAAPVAAPGAITLLRQDADAVITVDSPSAFRAIGQFYDDFSQTTDDEVLDLLGRAPEPG